MFGGMCVTTVGWAIGRNEAEAEPLMEGMANRFGRQSQFEARIGELRRLAHRAGEGQTATLLRFDCLVDKIRLEIDYCRNFLKKKSCTLELPSGRRTWAVSSRRTSSRLIFPST